MGRGAGGRWALVGGIPRTRGAKRLWPRPCPGHAMNGSRIVFHGGISAAQPRHGRGAPSRPHTRVPVLGKLRHRVGSAPGRETGSIWASPSRRSWIEEAFPSTPQQFALDNPIQEGAGHPLVWGADQTTCAQTPQSQKREENPWGGCQRCCFGPWCRTWTCPSPWHQAWPLSFPFAQDVASSAGMSCQKTIWEQGFPNTLRWRGEQLSAGQWQRQLRRDGDRWVPPWECSWKPTPVPKINRGVALLPSLAHCPSLLPPVNPSAGSSPGAGAGSQQLQGGTSPCAAAATMTQRQGV